MGLIVRSTDLTEKQEALVNCLCEGASLQQAAEVAGYSQVVSAQAALRLENVALAFQQRMSERLLRGAPQMFAVLEQIAHNRALPAGARVDAAKAWLDRAGWTVPRGVTKDSHDKPLHEMSAAELKATVLELKAIQADQVPVPSAPEGGQNGPSLDDMLS